jgi:large subunit ribosomal protein L17
MRHLCGYKRLGRKEGHRKALLRNLATSLVIHERINTTLPKAKELRSVVEHYITLGKRGDLHARRMAAAYFYDSAAVQKLFSSLASRYKSRPGGYTRILRNGIRQSDAANLALVELVDAPEAGEKSGKAEVAEKSESKKPLKKRSKA